MNEREIATILLYERANKILEYEGLHPRDVVEITKDFLCKKGCKNRSDYELMIRYLFANDGYTRALLLSIWWKGKGVKLWFISSLMERN